MPVPIQNPASYVPSEGVAFADLDGNSVTVSPLAPLPVNPLPAAAAALAGTAAAATLAGPFQPVAGRPVILTLSGVWSGLVQVLRSTDNGATRQPLTLGGAPWGQFTANCCEPVWDEGETGAQLYLDLAVGAGSVGYRLAQ